MYAHFDASIYVAMSVGRSVPRVLQMTFIIELLAASPRSLLFSVYITTFVSPRKATSYPKFLLDLRVYGSSLKHKLNYGTDLPSAHFYDAGMLQFINHINHVFNGF